MALSDVAIRKARPAPKPVRHFDGGGLYLEVSPSGGKLWRLKYRFGGNDVKIGSSFVPEPASLALVGLALAGLAVIRRRKV